MKCKLNWTSAQWKSHVSCNKQTGPLKSVLKRKLRIRAEMQRGLERSLGADWGSKWCKCGRQKVRRLKTCNPSYHFHSGMWQKFVKTATSVKTMQDGEEYLWAAACCWPINWLEDEGPRVKMQLQLRATTPPNFSANQNHPTFSDSWLMMGSRIL
jgi:hypothetical protein